MHTLTTQLPYITRYLAYHNSLCEPVRLTCTCIFSTHAGGEQPIPLWNEHDTSTDADKPKILLYSLSLMFKVSGVQFLTAWKSKVARQSDWPRRYSKRHVDLRNKTSKGFLSRDFFSVF